MIEVDGKTEKDRKEKDKKVGDKIRQKRNEIDKEETD